jgi:hypothetical protein
MNEETAARFAIEMPDWLDRDRVIAYLVELQRAGASESVPMDEDCGSHQRGADVRPHR